MNCKICGISLNKENTSPIETLCSLCYTVDSLITILSGCLSELELLKKKIKKE